MRIGIFTETYTPYISGLVTSIVMLKGALEKKGHEVYVVTANLKDFHYHYDEENRVLEIPGIPTGIYDSRLTSIYPLQAVNIIKKWHLDVIHSQTEFAIGTFARLFAKQYNIPIVHTYHTMYEDYVHYITKGYFNKSSKKLVEYLTKFYCDKTITELIVPTVKAYNLFKKKYNVERNVHIVPTGIEVDRFFKKNVPVKEVNALRKEYHLNRKDFVLIFVGRVAEEKNIPFLIHVVDHLKKEIPTIKLFIIGDGPDKEKYQKLTQDMDCEEQVIFTGKVPWDKIPAYYQLGNLFITASKTETQGLTVIEGMAASLPVVCMDDVAFHTMVFEDLNGKFFKDEESCEKVILELYNNKELRENLAKQAVIQAEHCSTEQYADNILIVYKRAIENNKKKDRFGILSKIFRKLRGEK